MNGWDRLLEIAGTPDDAQIGELARDRGLLTEAQLRECVEEQVRDDLPFVAAVLLRRGYFTPPVLLDLLKAERERWSEGLPGKGLSAAQEGVFLATALLADGTVTPRQVRAALRRQREEEAQGRHRRVAEILVRDGAVSLEDLRTRLLCVTCGTRFEDAGWTPERDPICRSCEGGTATSRTPIGPYRLLERIGGGVWKAWDPRLRRTVALKRVPDAAAEMPRFFAHVKALSRLHHPGVPAVHDAGVHDGCPYFTTDLVEGRTLREAMRDLSLNQAVILVRRLAEILHYVHAQGMAHRDVKPENILLDRDGRPYLVGFRMASEEVDRKKIPDATTGYMSPEQAAGNSPLAEPASDQFSLGAILYELAAGRRPDQGPLREGLNRAVEEGARSPNVPPDLLAICLKAMDPDPAHRFPTLEEFGRDLDRFLRGEPVTARALPLGRRLGRKITKNRWMMAAAIAVGALAWIGIRDREPSHQRRLSQGAAFEEGGQAEREYSEAPELEPGHGEAQGGLERVRAANHRSREAEAEARRRLEQEREASNLLERARGPLDAAAQYLYGAEARYDELLRRLAEVQPILEKAVASAPHHGLGHFLMARMWELQGWHDKAIECCRTAIDRDPSFGPARLLLARLLLQRSLYETVSSTSQRREKQKKRAEAEAVEAAEQIEAAAKGRIAVEDALPKSLAEAYLAFFRGETEGVRRLAREGIDRWGGAPGGEEFHWLLAVVSQEEERREALDRALALRPKFPLALLERGLIRLRRGDLEGALEDYTAAVEFHPRFPSALANRAVARRLKEDWRGAVEDFRKILAIDSSRLGYAHLAAGLEREREGDREGAMEEYGRAFEADRDLVIALNWRGALRIQKGDWDGALADFSAAVEEEEGYVEARANRAVARERKGDIAGALADLDEVLRIAPGYADGYRNRAVLRHRIGDWRGALGDCDQALRICPGDMQAAALRSAVHESMGNYDAALEDISRALERLGAGRPERAQFDQMRSIIERRRRSTPEWTRCWRSAQEALRGKREDEARRLLGEALSKVTEDDLQDPDLRLLGGFLHYELARANARAHRSDGALDAAFAALNRAIEWGYPHVLWLRRDPDLAPLRGDPRWTALLQRFAESEEQ